MSGLFFFFGEPSLIFFWLRHSCFTLFFPRERATTLTPWPSAPPSRCALRLGCVACAAQLGATTSPPRFFWPSVGSQKQGRCLPRLPPRFAVALPNAAPTRDGMTTALECGNLGGGKK